jgi:peptidoglycan/LPS O-acetylase OafA/YrhL
MAVAGYFTERGWCIGFIYFELGVLRGAAGFAAGVVIYRLHVRGAFARLPALSPELLLTLWVCIAAVPTATATPTFDWIAVMFLSPPLMILLLRAEHRAPSWFGKLGELSYPLYVIHPGIILLAQKTSLFGLNRGPNAMRALLVEATCLGAAWGIARLVARRAQALPRRQNAAA